MTNGEKIQTILDIDKDCTEVHGENGTMTFTVTQDFWNAEYKESTTKNNLAVDKLISDCEKMSFDMEIFNKPLKVVALDAVKNIVKDLPSVTSQEPTTKNDLGVEEHKGEVMDFPSTFDEFADDYGFKDTKEVYTNGSELIQVYRVKQWLEHINETTTMIDKSNFSQEQYKADLQSAYDCGYNQACKSKITMPYAEPDNCGNYIEQTVMSDLAVDCIDRTELLKAMDTWPKFGVDSFGYIHTLTEDNRNDLIPYVHYGDVISCIKGMSSVTPQPCEDAVSRQAVLYLIADDDLSMGQVVRGIHALPPVTPQPRKGHWIKGYTYPDGEYWKCDKCNELIKVKYPMYYCNNCGSDNSREVEE